MTGNSSIEPDIKTLKVLNPFFMDVNAHPVWVNYAFLSIVTIFLSLCKGVQKTKIRRFAENSHPFIYLFSVLVSNCIKFDIGKTHFFLVVGVGVV